MKAANLVVASLYTILLILLLVLALTPTRRIADPYGAAGAIFFSGPVIMNWLCFSHWHNPASRVKTATLVVAILYTVTLLTSFAAGLTQSDGQLLLGSLLFVPPVLLNWLSVLCWPALCAPTPTGATNQEL